MDLTFGLEQTLGISIIVLLLGQLLSKKINFLNKFCIPAPVIGGLIFALITLLGYVTKTFTVEIDTTLKDFFMLCFFTSVGFGANLKVLKKSGAGVMLFLIAAVGLVIIQNLTGILLALGLGENPLLGMLTGSISMIGGHGTAGAFGPLIESAGLSGAETIGIAAATFGLVAGSMIGGPTGKRLVDKFNLRSEHDEVVADYEEINVERTILSAGQLSNGFFQIGIAIGLGTIVSAVIQSTGMTMPTYIGAMLVAAIMRNILKDDSKQKIRIEEINALGSMFLSVFLVQALMGLQLWQLADLALPLFVILIAQVIIMFLYANFFVFKIMGKDYDAAVLAAGSCGFGLGATPNGIANMNAITNKYGASAKAFFILPIVGSLFIDFINSGIIVMFIQFLK